jgi:hypothetical protein
MGTPEPRAVLRIFHLCPGVVDLHVEVRHAGACRTVVSDSSQRHAEVYSGILRSILACREETHLVEHGDASPLQQHIVLRDHLHSINSCMRDEGWRVVDHQLEELPRLYLMIGVQ